MRVRWKALAATGALLIFALFSALPVARGALEDQLLSGMIYQCDGTFLGDTPYANGTQFWIMVEHAGTFRNYTANATEGGWYSYWLPTQDKGMFWDDGDPYWVFVDGTPWNGLNTSYLSNGSGDFGVPPMQLIPEFTGFGTPFNTIVWYGGTGGDPLDNRQQWDVIENCADLIPTNVTVNGSPYPVSPGATGPCWLVGFNATIPITANVTNVGQTWVNLSTNVTFYNSTTILSESAVPPVGPGAVTGPYFANWTAPLSPGIFYIDITADFPSPGRIVETNETNNTVTVCLMLQGPDLVPWNVTVADPLTTKTPPNDGSTVDLVVSLGDPVFFGGWVRNLGWVDATDPFDLVLWNATDGILDWAAYSGLANNTTAPTNVSFALTPPAIGVYDYWIMADSEGTFDPADGNVTEMVEDNNTRLIRITVRGPDLIPANVTVDSSPPFPDGSSPQAVPATFGQSYWLAAWVRNVGSDNVSVPFTVEISNETGVKFSRQFLPPLLPGETNTSNVSYVWTATFIGTTCFNITVDVSDDVIETVETNNTFQVCFGAGGPDLVPSNVAGNGVGGTVLVYVGDTVDINATATNLGDLTTSVGFRIAFHTAPNPNCIPGQLDQPPFATFDLPPLGAGGTSAVVGSAWSAVNNGTFYVSVVVDSLDAVTEVSEINNCVSLTIVVGGFPDLIPTNAQVDGSAYSGPVDLAAGQTVMVAAQARNVGVVDTAVFGGSFVVTLFNNSDGSEFGNSTFSGSLPPDTTTAQAFSGLWTAPLAVGTYDVTVYVDRWNDIQEDPVPTGANETNNSIVLTFNVFGLVGSPSPVITYTAPSDTLDWSDDPGPPEAVAYNVYGGPDPTSIDFGNPLNPTPITATSFAYTPASDEFYYVVRSLDSRGWEGPSSGIVGRFAKAFPRGYSTFSLPLEPLGSFRAHDLTGELMVTDSDAVFAYDAATQSWTGHAAGMPATVSNFELRMGQSYMIYLNIPAEFVFVGRPGADIRFVDFPGDPRVGASAGDASFRVSLQLTPVDGGVRVDWSAAQDLRGPLSPFEFPASYRVYRALARGGPYAVIGDVTGVTFTDLDASAGELYYMVVPVNGFGREGSSTFAAGIVWTAIVRGYNSYGLHFSTSEVTVSDFVAGHGMSDPAVVFAYDPGGQRWIGHALLMPTGVGEFVLTHSEGYYINVMHEGVVLVVAGR